MLSVRGNLFNLFYFNYMEVYIYEKNNKGGRKKEQERQGDVNQSQTVQPPQTWERL